MKKQVLLFTALLIGLTTVTANEIESVNTADDLRITNSRYAQPITFMERGIEFMIFPDGSFDFNTNARQHTGNFGNNYYYRNASQTRRGSVNHTFGAPVTNNRVHYAAPRNRGVLISHDANGQVRRIGNVYINYDRNGKIKRAGSVYMSYNNRNGLLKQVGGLHINYNHWGQIISQYGMVNPFNNTCQVCGIINCTVSHGSTNHHSNNGYNNNPEDYYYYKSDNTDTIKTPKKPQK